MLLGAHRHPKFKALRRLLGSDVPATIGYLELLWHFTGERADCGDVGKWSDDDIEEACHWAGKPGEMVAAMVTAGFLDPCGDHRLVVHDWGVHMPRYLRQRLERAGAEPLSRATAPTSAVRRHAAPTIPNPTQPNPTETAAPTSAATPSLPAVAVSVEKLWNEYNEARLAYLPNTTGLKLSDKHQKRMSVIRKKFGPSAHVDAVHGAIAFHLGTDFDAARHISPDTVWQDGKIPKYLAADADAQAAGLVRPYSDSEYKRQSTEATVSAAMHALANPGKRNR